MVRAGEITQNARLGTRPIGWTSGQINWLLDVIAPDRKVTGQVLANFRQVVKEGELRLHPLVAKMVEPEVLEKLRSGKESRRD